MSIDGLFLTKDLIFTSKILPVASRIGATLKVVSDRAELLELAAKDPVKLVLLDLHTPGLVPDRLVGQLHDLDHRPTSIVAFGAHVHRNRLIGAEEAGCDAVITRGQLDRNAEEILRRYLLSNELS